MKKLSLTLILCSFFVATSVFGQQWNGSSNTNGNINRSGNVGIGTTSPNVLLHLKTNIVPPRMLLNGSYTAAYTPVSLRLQTYASDVNSNYYWDITSGMGLSFTYFTNQQTPSNVLNISQNTMTYYGTKIVIKNNGINQLALYDDGRIHAREVEVNLDVIPDYVFATDYELMPLAELQKFIDLNHHLPNIKSAEEYAAYGRIPLKELNLKLLEKVEELTLYTLAQQEEIEALKVANAEIENLKKQMAALQIQLELLNKK